MFAKHALDSAELSTIDGPFELLCQSDRMGREERVAHQVAALEDIPLHWAVLKELARYSTNLLSGTLVPIGSVEFVRRAMQLASVIEPGNLCYPHVLSGYLHRSLDECEAAAVKGRWFVKPTVTKAFTGFIFDTLKDPKRLPPDDRIQHNAFIALDGHTRVWRSEPVRWLSEVRYYVLEGAVLGEARYDDGPDKAPLPSRAVVQEMVDRYSASSEAPVAYAIDIGVLDGGSTALVEVNDMWAVGFYSGTITPRAYVTMLLKRWAQLAAYRVS